MRPVERRVVLLSLAAFAVLGGVSRALCLDERVSWDQFVRELLPLAEESVRRGPHHHRGYLQSLAALAARTGWERDLSSSLDRTHVLERRPVEVCLFQLPLGGRIPAHDHRGYCALMKVLSGQLVIDEYEATSAATEGTFAVRAAGRRTLGVGSIAVAAMDGANIHEVSSPHGEAQFVDIFTIFEGEGTSRRVELEGPESDATLRARWGSVM